MSGDERTLVGRPTGHGLIHRTRRATKVKILGGRGDMERGRRRSRHRGHTRGRSLP